MTCPNRYHPDWIVAFVRPWDADFFRRMANRLAQDYEDCGMSRPRIRILTFWNETRKRLQGDGALDHEVVFLPDKMKKVKLDDSKRAVLAQAERDLLDRGMSPLKTMMEAERFAPGDGVEAEKFMWRMFVVLNELIPDGSVVLSNQPDHVCYWLACELCNAKGGRYFGFCISGRPSGHTQVLKNACEPWNLALPEVEHYEMVDKQISEIKADVLPSYMYKANPYPGLSKKVSIIRSRINEAVSGNYFMSWRVLPMPIKYRARELSWKLLGPGVRSWNIDELEQPFVYFPLHLEPEASTLVWAPYFKYQGVVLEWLAKSLPAGVDLVVKENPKMWGQRPRSFYSTAARLPGVKWIEPRTSSRDLILASDAVVTITGTVAIESMALGRPVAILGNPPYSYTLKSLPRFKCPEDIPGGLQALLKSTVDTEAFRDEYARYIANLISEPFNETRTVSGTPYPIYSFKEAHAAHVIRLLKA